MKNATSHLDKSTLMWTFLEVIVVVFFFWVSQMLLHCIQIYWKNLEKMGWKIKTYILIFQTQIFFYQKDKCSI
jgi:hypothetical protein